MGVAQEFQIHMNEVRSILLHMTAYQMVTAGVQMKQNTVEDQMQQIDYIFRAFEEATNIKPDWSEDSNPYFALVMLLLSTHGYLLSMNHMRPPTGEGVDEIAEIMRNLIQIVVLACTPKEEL